MTARMTKCFFRGKIYVVSVCNWRPTFKAKIVTWAHSSYSTPLSSERTSHPDLCAPYPGFCVVFSGSCAGLLAFHILQTAVHAVKQGVHGPEAMTHTQLSAAPSVSVDFHSHSPWLSADFGVENSGPSVKHSGSSGLNFLPKVAQIKSRHYLFTPTGTYNRHSKSL